jgi:hypothetical protein
MRNESFEKLFNEFKCGEMIDELNDIPRIVLKISNNYENYSLEAKNAYSRFYDFNKNVIRFKKFYFQRSELEDS